MQIVRTRIEDGTVQYECRDSDNKMYGVVDTIQGGAIMGTLVLDMKTLDEVEDSELFKCIVMARSYYLSDNYHLLEEIKAIY